MNHLLTIYIIYSSSHHVEGVTFEGWIPGSKPPFLRQVGLPFSARAEAIFEAMEAAGGVSHRQVLNFHYIHYIYTYTVKYGP